ncbi:MAG TPA: gamma-glutamyltransferase [archaeon]|nr:gamma-glutamyltransferase [archaeon]
MYFQSLCRAALAAGLILSLTPCAPAYARHHPMYSNEGMVASAEPVATQVGFEVLRAGGNAADAAVAVGFALAVAHPIAGNIGGGGFIVYREPSGEVHTLDYREKAPEKARRDMFLGPDRKPDSKLSTKTLLAVGVPGSVAGMLETLERFGSGRLSRQEIMAPAIRLAEQGFPVSLGWHETLRDSRERLAVHPSTAAVFYPGGKVPDAGDTLRQPDLTRTLREIASRGRAGFYSGWVADSLAHFMAANGGLITRADLAAYVCVPRPPVIFTYQGYRFYGMGPPSSGAVVLGQILGLLEPFDLKSMGHNSAAYVYHLVEAERLAYADRNHFLGDPDFVKIPLKSLLAKSYLDRRRSLIPENAAGKSSPASHGAPEHFQTTHFSVVDSRGGAAAITTTLNGGFGMGAVVPGAGFLLNNEMDDFSAAPGKPNLAGLVQGEANAVAGGKRMLSSMTPTIITRLDKSGNAELFLVLGASGGPTITTSVLQVFLNMAHFGMNVREAIEAPRFHHQHLPDVVYTEKAFPEDTRKLLAGMGYTLEERQYIGSAAAIAALPEGWFAGWADGVGAGAGTGF